MKKLAFGLLLALTLLLPALSARANDEGIDGVSGRPRVLTRKNATIRMQSETVDITIQDPVTYVTDATFVFVNDGPAVTVPMGFPERAYGDFNPPMAGKAGFLSFQTWVDGQPIQATRRVLVNAPDQDTFDAVWAKLVSFPANGTRHVRVRCLSRYGGAQGPVAPQHYVSYDFTGQNWKGEVDSSVLTIHMNRPGTYLACFVSDDAKPVLVRKNHDFIYTWRHWQAHASIDFFFCSTLRDFLSTPDDISEETAGTIPIKIDFPGVDLNESTVDYLAPGRLHQGELTISLQSWLAWATDQKLVTDSVDGPNIKVTAGGSTTTFTPSDPGTRVVHARDGDAWYVPASRLTALYGAKFDADLPHHKIVFSAGN